MNFNKLSQPIDIASLAFFRIVFGAAMLIDVLNNFLSGWIYTSQIAPKMHFTYYGFGWIQPLPGWGMYVLWAVMGGLSINIMIGWRYRISAILFAIGTVYAFLIDSADYLNHGYLMCLLSILMIFFPANRAWSLDAKRNPAIQTDTIPYWSVFLLQFQMAVVYFYGGLAKLNPDWLQAQPIKTWLAGKGNYFLIGDIITQEWFAYFISYGGLAFDLCIVPLLVFKRTRILALVVVIFFHITNKILFDIGVFPILSIALTLMFFSPSWSRPYLEQWFSGNGRRLLKFDSKDTRYLKTSTSPKGNFKSLSSTTSNKKMPQWALGIILLYCVLQLLIPLRHHLYPNNVAWTEQGHRFSWRMMLRSKSAIAHFKGTDTKTGKTWTIHPSNYLNSKQERKMKVHPDMILQFAHYLKEEYKKNGMEDVLITANIVAGLNGRPKKPFVKTTKNLAVITENPFKAIDWLEPFPNKKLKRFKDE
ncbi:MAG: HTTM domain-containing protein [Chitinophagales bacterium]